MTASRCKHIYVRARIVRVYIVRVDERMDAKVSYFLGERASSLSVCEPIVCRCPMPCVCIYWVCELAGYFIARGLYARFG